MSKTEAIKFIRHLISEDMEGEIKFIALNTALAILNIAGYKHEETEKFIDTLLPDFDWREFGDSFAKKMIKRKIQRMLDKEELSAEDIEFFEKLIQAQYTG